MKSSTITIQAWIEDGQVHTSASTEGLVADASELGQLAGALVGHANDLMLTLCKHLPEDEQRNFALGYAAQFMLPPAKIDMAEQIKLKLRQPDQTPPGVSS